MKLITRTLIALLHTATPPTRKSTREKYQASGKGIRILIAADAYAEANAAFRAALEARDGPNLQALIDAAEDASDVLVSLFKDEPDAGPETENGVPLWRE